MFGLPENAAACPPVSALNRVVFPDPGSPMIPHSMARSVIPVGNVGSIRSRAPQDHSPRRAAEGRGEGMSASRPRADSRGLQVSSAVVMRASISAPPPRPSASSVVNLLPRGLRRLDHVPQPTSPATATASRDAESTRGARPRADARTFTAEGRGGPRRRHERVAASRRFRVVNLLPRGLRRLDHGPQPTSPAPATASSRRRRYSRRGISMQPN